MMCHVLWRPLYIGDTLSTVTDKPLSVAVLHQFASPCHADIEVGDLLSERIAVDPQQIRTFRLISTGCIQRDLDQRKLHLPQNPLIQTRRR